MAWYRVFSPTPLLLALVLLSACDTMTSLTNDDPVKETEVVIKASEETRVSSRTPERNLDGTELRVINHADGWRERSYVRFDLSSIPADARVLEARVELFYYHCKDIDDIVVSPAAGAWTASTLTWDNQPGPVRLSSTAEIVNLGPDFAKSGHCGDLGRYVATSGGAASKPGWLITELAQNWVRGVVDNRGLVFSAYSEYSTLRPPGRLLAVFGSSEDTQRFQAQPPRLHLRYTR